MKINSVTRTVATGEVGLVPLSNQAGRQRRKSSRPFATTRAPTHAGQVAKGTCGPGKPSAPAFLARLLGSVPPSPAPNTLRKPSKVEVWAPPLRPGKAPHNSPPPTPHATNPTQDGEETQHGPSIVGKRGWRVALRQDGWQTACQVSAGRHPPFSSDCAVYVRGLVYMS